MEPTKSGVTCTSRLKPRAKTLRATAVRNAWRVAVIQMPRPGSRRLRSGTAAPSGETTKRIISATGFTVTASGSLDVTTAPLYVPGRSYTVTAGGGQQIVAADPDGRLDFTLDLGPSHQVQQYRFEPDSTADWVSLDVAIAG